MMQQDNLKLNTENSKFIPPYPLNTAVLFIVFNRLDTTKQVFQAIRQAKPPRLYIAADGARANKEGEAEKVKLVRDFIMQNIDWECEVKTLFRDQNLGCGKNVNESITWFFNNEDCGIILEDDCLPEQSFFWFCEQLLTRYIHDQRLGMIAGTNHIGKKVFSESYCFSKYKACWGWASWARAWNNMELGMEWRGSVQAEDIVKNMGLSKVSEKHWRNALASIEAKSVDAWDWQWYFSLSANYQLTIFPKKNLISNLGFGDEATHTKGNAPINYLKTQSISFPLSHPKYICQNYTYDTEFENLKIRNKSLRRFIPKKIKVLIKKILKI
jgi:hypothetical protein